jgi:hypothetical protein
MPIDVIVPHFRGYDTPEAAISASSAISSEFSWFAPKALVGRKVVDFSFAPSRLDLQLDDGQLMSFWAGQHVLEGSLTTDPLPATQWDGRPIHFRYYGRRVREYRFDPLKGVAWVVGREVYDLTFDPEYVFVIFKSGGCVFICLLRSRCGKQAYLSWSRDD